MILDRDIAACLVYPELTLRTHQKWDVLWRHTQQPLLTSLHTDLRQHKVRDKLASVQLYEGCIATSWKTSKDVNIHPETSKQTCDLCIADLLLTWLSEQLYKAVSSEVAAEIVFADALPTVK